MLDLLVILHLQCPIVLYQLLITNLVTKAGNLEQQLLSKVDTTLFENFREATSRELKQRLTATDLNGYVKSTELVQTANEIGSIVANKADMSYVNQDSSGLTL
mgnify:CR=1 FL=1